MSGGDALHIFKASLKALLVLVLIKYAVIRIQDMSEQVMAAVQLHDDPVELYKKVDAYDWNDAEFQSGLQAILGSSSDADRVAHLTLRARCFYYSRKFKTRVDFNAYEQWTHGQQARSGDTSTVHSEDYPVSSAPATHGDAPTPATFAEICELIAEGKPIPGIKDIPAVVLEGQGTHSQATRRKKPWEKHDAPAETPSWAQ